MLTGSLACFRPPRWGNRREDQEAARPLRAVHGSAPDSRQGTANPIAMIGSLGWQCATVSDSASRGMIERRIAGALPKVCAPRHCGKGAKTIGTSEMGEAIVAELDSLAGRS